MTMPGLPNKNADDAKHVRFLNEVLSLNKRTTLKNPTRTEPTSQISEFNLVRSVRDRKGTVRLNELTKVLSKRAKHVEISKNVASSRRKAKTLPKPLEKPRAERIRRTVAFGNVKGRLNRWDAVVMSNRSQHNISFPLPSMSFENDKHLVRFRLKSNLQKELEAITEEEKGEVVDLELAPKYPLTMEEMLERRRETAKMRAVQSYKEAKARRQNKIKSKKYHRVQRRENVKKQIKEFEQLQKSNPEEALKKLEEIERVRVEERASLRHRSTGKWAQNKQVQAKYNKESRQALAQQLTLSRDLTQKIKPQTGHSESEEEEEGNAHRSVTEDGESNVWTNSKEVTNQVAEFLQGYRKFWQEENDKRETTLSSDNPMKTAKENDTLMDDDVLEAPKDRLRVGTTDWDISLLSDEAESDREVENLNSRKLEEIPIMKNFESRLEKKPDRKLTRRKTKRDVDLSFPLTARRPIMKEQLSESGGTYHEKQNSSVNDLKAIMENNSLDVCILDSKQSTINTDDKNDYTKTKTVDLDTDLPDLFTPADEEDLNQKGTIGEAFEDDDVIEEFAKEKQEEVEGEKTKDVDLSLPGWGAWGGFKIAPSKRKNKRFIVSFPKQLNRRDDNKGPLIISEKGAKKIKNHLVSEVPFPFKTVKDFEASIRSPISNTFVPETAYRKSIRPAIRTKIGTIITPMTEDVLLKKRKIR